MNVKAMWGISIETQCPKCEYYFNITDIPDFWDGRILEMGECDTDNSKDIEVYCIECEHEFLVDLYW